MTVRTMTAAAALLAAAFLIPYQPAQAFVALAIGVTGDPNDGIAIGSAFNYKTQAAARDSALHECRTFGSAPKANRQCRLVGVFEKACIAAVFDPKSDSTGMGWAVAPDRSAAERQAMDLCQAAAPSGRAQFCKLDISRCEGE